MRLRAVAIMALAFAALLGLVGEALAQDGGGGGGDARTVMVLKFDTFDVDPAVVQLFEEQMRVALEEHPELEIKAGAKLTAGDLATTAGCDAPTVECLQGLKGMLGVDQVIFGSIQATDNVHLFTLKQLDLERGEFVGALRDQTLEGGQAELREGIPALIEGMLYGPVGQLAVRVEGAEGVVVLFDEEERGMAPLRLEGLPLGEHVITARSPGGEEKTEKVLLRRGQPEEVVFTFEPQVTTTPITERPDRVGEGAGGTGGMVISGWILSAAGVGGLVLGMVNWASLSSLNEEVEEIRARSCGPQGCALSDADHARLVEIEGTYDSESGNFVGDGENDSTYTMAMIGTTVGAAALITGGVLLYLGYTGEAAVEGESDATISDLRFGVGPGEGGGMAVGVGGRF